MTHHAGLLLTSHTVTTCRKNYSAEARAYDRNQELVDVPFGPLGDFGMRRP